jgi:hypothetical protein
MEESLVDGDSGTIRCGALEQYEIDEQAGGVKKALQGPGPEPR